MNYKAIAEHLSARCRKATGGISDARKARDEFRIYVSRPIHGADRLRGVSYYAFGMGILADTPDRWYVFVTVYRHGTFDVTLHRGTMPPEVFECLQGAL